MRRQIDLDAVKNESVTASSGRHHSIFLLKPPTLFLLFADGQSQICLGTPNRTSLPGGISKDIAAQIEMQTLSSSPKSSSYKKTILSLGFISFNNFNICDVQ